MMASGEWEARVTLAACYRLVARMGLDDLIYNHISLRVPGQEDQFLINPYGLMFDEITASSLVKIDTQGRKIAPSDYEVNVAAFVIHAAFHDYEGVAIDLDEQQRLVRDLGPHKVMLLRNHGILTLGRTVGEAFMLLYYFERAAKIQLMLQAAGTPFLTPSPEVCERAARQFWEQQGDILAPGEREWPGFLRQLDRSDPSYKT